MPRSIKVFLAKIIEGLLTLVSKSWTKEVRVAFIHDVQPKVQPSEPVGVPRAAVSLGTCTEVEELGAPGLTWLLPRLSGGWCNPPPLSLKGWGSRQGP